MVTPCLSRAVLTRAPLPQVYQGGEDGHGRRIFVGNVNYEVNEDDLRDHFGKVRSRAGPKHARAQTCARGGGWRQLSPAPCLQYGDISMLSAKEGFAFIEYTDPNAATVRALSPLFARTPSLPS